MAGSVKQPLLEDGTPALSLTAGIGEKALQLLDLGERNFALLREQRSIGLLTHFSLPLIDSTEPPEGQPLVVDISVMLRAAGFRRLGGPACHTSWRAPDLRAVIHSNTVRAISHKIETAIFSWRR